MCDGINIMGVDVDTIEDVSCIIKDGRWYQLPWQMEDGIKTSIEVLHLFQLYSVYGTTGDIIIINNTFRIISVCQRPCIGRTLV